MGHLEHVVELATGQSHLLDATEWSLTDLVRGKLVRREDAEAVRIFLDDFAQVRAGRLHGGDFFAFLEAEQLPVGQVERLVSAKGILREAESLALFLRIRGKQAFGDDAAFRIEIEQSLGLV